MLDTYYIMDTEVRIRELNQRDPNPVPLNVGQPYCTDPDYGSFRGRVVYESVRETDLGNGWGTRTTFQLIDIGRAPDVQPNLDEDTLEDWATLLREEYQAKREREAAALRLILTEHFQTSGPRRTGELVKKFRIEEGRLRKFLKENFVQIKRGLWGLPGQTEAERL